MMPIEIILFRFKYTPAESWFGLSTTGRVSIYDQGGFIQNLADTQQKYFEQIQYLKDK